jgi:hypothetical protein
MVQVECRIGHCLPDTVHLVAYEEQQQVCCAFPPASAQQQLWCCTAADCSEMSLPPLMLGSRCRVHLHTYSLPREVASCRSSTFIWPTGEARVSRPLHQGSSGPSLGGTLAVGLPLLLVLYIGSRAAQRRQRRQHGRRTTL